MRAEGVRALSARARQSIAERPHTRVADRLGRRTESEPNAR